MFFGSEIALTPGLSVFARYYIKLLGAPIMGLRIRARTILPLLAEVGQPKRIADAGSGRGMMTLACARRFPQAEVIGVDLLASQNAINNTIARQVGLGDRLHFETWDVLRLPELGRFDAIICTDALEHIDDDLSTVKMFYEALNPGGHVLIHVPHLTRNLFGWHQENWMDIEGHVRPGYTREGLSTLLQRGGFRVKKCVYNYNSLETLATNISKRISGGRESNQGLYALAFPGMMCLAALGALYTPKHDGSGLVAVAVREG